MNTGRDTSEAQNEIEATGQRNTFGVAVRGIAIWTILILAEIVHGIARSVLLVPYVGEFRSRQIGVFSGSVLILAIAFVFVKWLGASRSADFLTVGLIWVVLTLAFEVLFGRFVMGLSWERLTSDYKVWEGGLLPLGMIVLLFAPLIAGKLRGIV